MLARGTVMNSKSLANLRPRQTTYSEAKKSRDVTVTQPGWDGFKSLAASLDLSASELIERLGRGFMVLPQGEDTIPLEVVAHGRGHKKVKAVDDKIYALKLMEGETDGV